MISKKESHLKSIIIVAAVLLFLSAGLFYGEIPTSERAALIALYNATDGDNWTNNSGWKGNKNEPDGFSQIGSEGSWFGITVWGDRVDRISLQSNNLSGIIPPELGRLGLLNLSNNNLYGSIPSELGNVGSLNLSYNNLSGSIPANFDNLSSLNLSHNNLSGGISPYFTEYMDLGLDLSHNNLSGPLPTKYFSGLAFIKFDFSNNNFSGTIPSELERVEVDFLNLSNNNLSGTIPTGLIRKVSFLDLSRNNLTGGIPTEGWEFATSYRLNFSHNKLTGNIPAELGKHQDLKELKLNGNILTGSIPEKITNLVNLVAMDIGFNSLFTSTAGVQAFLNEKDPDWFETQTITATEVSAVVTSPSSVLLAWTPTVYTGDSGGYNVFYSTTSGGPWTLAGMTENKSIGNFTVTGLNYGSTYYFMLQTQTNPHSNNKNILVSEYSEQVHATLSNIPFITMFLNRSRLNFGAVKGLTTAPAQSLSISSSGTFPLQWTAACDLSCVRITPSSGTGPSNAQVSIDPAGLAAGTYNGTINVSDPYAANSPVSFPVQVVVKESGQNEPIFGSFDSPVDGSTVRSSIAVTGWALDDIGVKTVKIYRDNQVYIGDAVLVEGARPDVEQSYPDYPGSYKAGWGYMLLTNFLPGGGNGTFTLYAVATDVSGIQSCLGSKTIHCDNANAIKPFGAIDTPAEGGTASSTSFVNFGWALSPQPNTIPIDGSTINVWIDGVPLGHPVYNNYRSDIAFLFPGYNNSNGAVGYFYMDTTAYENGVHTIAWSVKDNAGNSDGIGSRYFTINNISNRQTRKMASLLTHESTIDQSPVSIQKGFLCDKYQMLNTVYPDAKGSINITIQPLQRLAVHLEPNSNFTHGYQQQGKRFLPLPIGSFFDPVSQTFTWQPGPGFAGLFKLVFVQPLPGGKGILKVLNIRIYPQAY